MSKEHPGMCYNNCVQNLMYRIRDRGTRKKNSGLYTSEDVKMKQYENQDWNVVHQMLRSEEL